MERQKRIAVVNDFSGFGRCSLTVSIPIISASGIQCCALPTAVLSNHTGYEDYFFDDYTDKMKPYYMKWEKLGLSFDGIYTGFLGSERQVDIIAGFLHRFTGEKTVRIIDPVMGDNGRTYATLTGSLCRRLRHLAEKADILTPNVTEACILTGMPYSDAPEKEMILEMGRKLRKAGSKNIIITGVNDGNIISNYVFSVDGRFSILSSPVIGKPRAGTGDVFASVIAADAVKGLPLEESVRRAAGFVSRAISISEKRGIPEQDGLCFEELLSISQD